MTVTAPAKDIDRPLRQRLRRRRLISLLLVLVVFVSGLVIGVAAGPFFTFRHGLERLHSPGEMPVRLAERMIQELDLTDEQARQVRAVLDQHFEELAALYGEVQPRRTRMMDDFRADVVAILTPEQAEQWTERFDRMRQKFMRFGPPPLWRDKDKPRE